MNSKQQSTFFDRLKQFVEDKELIKLILSNKRDESSDLKNVIATIVNLKAGYRLNIVYRHNTKDITKNYPFEEGLEIILGMFTNNFLNGEIIANTENIKLTLASESLFFKKPEEFLIFEFDKKLYKYGTLQAKQK